MNNDDLMSAIGRIDERFLAECREFAEKRRQTACPRKVFRRLAVIAAAAAGAALLTGAALTVFRVWFPSNFENKTKYSAAIYDIEPFKMSIELPEGCIITSDFENPEDASAGWSPMDIRLNGKSVGTADYNIFEIYPDSPSIHEENFYRMVYNQLMLGVQDNWNNDYTVVKRDEASENAVTKISVIDPEVYGSGRAPEPEDITYLPGILAFNTEMLVYVNIRFDDGVFTDEQIEDIAKSIVLSR